MREQGPPSFDDRESFQKQEKALRKEAQKVITNIEEGAKIAINAVEAILNQNLERLKNTLSQTDLEDMRKNADRKIKQINIDTQDKIEKVQRELYQNISKLKSRFNFIIEPTKTKQEKQTVHTKGARAFSDPDADEKIAKELGWK